VAPLAAILESAEAGELTPQKAMSATQTALVLMGNAQQQMAQERRKKLILKLNPSIKFMAEDTKSFSSAVPMLFGEEFSKQAVTTVEQVKAIKQLNIPSKKKGHFSDYHLCSYQNSCRGGANNGCARFQPYYSHNPGGSQTGQSHSAQNSQNQRT